MGLLKELLDWSDAVGCQGELWCRGDWHQPLRLLSRVLAPQLVARWQTNGHDLADVTFKISFDSMLQLAEETLGVPSLVTERDLMLQHPNLYVAVLTCLVCLHSTLDSLDHKTIRQTTPPKLVFEARNGSDATFPTCPGCDLHVFFIERVLIDGCVWHRQCLRCARCGSQLRRGGFRRAKDGSLECIQHLPRATLDALLVTLHSASVRTPRPVLAPPPTPPKPKMKPIPPPKPTNLKRLSESSEERHYESLEVVIVDTCRLVQEFEKSCANIVEKKTDVNEDTQVPVEGICNELPKISVDSESSSGDSLKENGIEERPRVSPRVVFRQAAPVDSDLTPVRPPRPKRASQLLQQTGRIGDPPPKPAPRSPVPAPRVTKPLTIDIVDYPGFLNPFGDDDDEEDSTVDDSLNPFADDMEEEEKPQQAVTPRPAPTPSPRSLATLPGTSDRPRSQPPPPPPLKLQSAAAPSPPSKFCTLPRTKKTFKAPLPPVPQRRKIMFTEHDPNATADSTMQKVLRVEEEMTKLEVIGASTEKELLINISQNPSDWPKGKKVNEFLEAVQSKVELIRQQNSAMYLWLEAFLNEIHSEIEYQLRCLIEKDAGSWKSLGESASEKTNEELEAEAKLLELLVEILTQKSELVQSQVDPETPSEDASKKKKLFIRMKKLKKKLRSNKK